MFAINIVTACDSQSVNDILQAKKQGNKPITAKPRISTKKALNGAQLMALSDSTSNATIYYTLDGSVPSTMSPIYTTPVLIASNTTVKAMAIALGRLGSSVVTRKFTPNIASNTLVWADEFNNHHEHSIVQPSDQFWGYDTGSGGWGNNELEYYCAANSNLSPCSSSMPNTFIDTDGALHIVARQAAAGTYTSARMTTANRFSFKYGRIEIRAKISEGRGLWPAFWLLGNNIATVGWPGCGEMDVLEHVSSTDLPDWNMGSIHGIGFIGKDLSIKHFFSPGKGAAEWHTYGMIWSKDAIAYYIDDPANPYVTFVPADIQKYPESSWPFNHDAAFLIFNLAVGGDWPGSPDASTVFPAELVVDYVRIYSQ